MTGDAEVISMGWGQGQPCHLRLAARGCRSSCRTSRQECEDLRRCL